MNLEELVGYLRINILDDTGGTGINWKNIYETCDENALLRWSNESLTEFINEAIRKACRSSYLLKDMQVTFDITLLDGEDSYSLDPRIIKVKSVRLKSSGNRLSEIASEDIWDEVTRSGREGLPTSYFVDEITGEIGFYPTPTTASGLEDVEFITYREEMTPLDWDGDTEDSPEVNPRYHVSILNYAAYLAYLKDEANSLDPQRAAQFLTLFREDFDDNSVYTEVRRVRRKRGTTSYGGIG